MDYQTLNFNSATLTHLLTLDLLHWQL